MTEGKHGIRSEDELFDQWRDRLANRAPKLYRDGPPSPDVYGRQDQRVVFVFREPNIPLQQDEHDLREELAGSDVTFGGLVPWWRDKVSILAHAVTTALEGRAWEDGWKENRELHKAKDSRLLDELHKYAYVQLKKTGGGGSSVGSILRWYVKQDRVLLQEQLQNYAPQLIIGCGLGSGRPAGFLREYVFPESYGSAKEVDTESRTFSYWVPKENAAAPGTLIEFYHPAARGVSYRTLYKSLWTLVSEVVAANP